MVGEQQILIKLIKQSFVSYSRMVDKTLDMSFKDLSYFAHLQLSNFVSTRKWFYAKTWQLRLNR